jgi:hypothetical protein
VSQDLFDVPDGAAIEQQLGGGGVPEQVWGDGFADARKPAVSSKRPPDIVAA